MMKYQDYLENKKNIGELHGFDPKFMPSKLMDFQRALVEWAVRKGRGAVFADCGLGKTAIQLTWAENVVRKTNGRVLVLTPLAVGAQTVREGEKFGIGCCRSRQGELSGKIIVTNYERLHYYKPEDFVGCVCDESSILKNFDGEYKKQITWFMRKMKYRLLCTATAAPNDYMELGTSSEALGELDRKHVLTRFFTHDGGDTAAWVLKGHVKSRLFWRWVCSWARACRRPSDMGFEDGPFILPPLEERDHILSASRKNQTGFFILPAVGLNEQRQERRDTIRERCEMAAGLAGGHSHSVLWCHLNPEGNLLEKLVKGSVQVCGSQSDDEKEEKLTAFLTGQAKVLVTKPMCAGFGLNMQHCAHMTFFPSHSYEQYYQATRRCWRFGQKRKVVVDVVTTEGERSVMKNLLRKAKAADEMFSRLVACMNDSLSIDKTVKYDQKEEVPSWL